MVENEKNVKDDILNNQNLTQSAISIYDENITYEDLNEIPRETIMNIYGNDFDNLTALLNEEELKVKDYFIGLQSNLKEKYNTFKTRINSHLKQLTNKITNSFNLENNDVLFHSDNALQKKEKEKSLLIQKYSKEYIKKIENIIDNQNQILKSVKETMNIFLNYLDISNFLDKEKPINDFINREFKNIINSWLFLKLNLDKFDFAQALNDSGLDNNLKNFIMKICEGKKFVMNIAMPKDYINDEFYKSITIKGKGKVIQERNKNKKILMENNNNLVKLKMTNINNVDNYFDGINSFENMKSLNVKNISFKNNSDDFLKKFKNLKKLSLNNIKNFEIKMLENLSQNLKYLSLSNNEIVDFEFITIINDYLKKSNDIRNNLEYLSFSSNNLSHINLNEIIEQKFSFYSLTYLDLSKNSIYKFDIPFEFFPELKCINLCYNNLSRDYFSNIHKDKIISQSGNLFLSNSNLAKRYFNDLSLKLNKLQINLVYLNLSFITNLFCNDYFSKLEINDNILLGLKKIKFEYNNMTNETFFNFINKNKGMLNLKSLGLRGNQINDLFFEEYLKLKLNLRFTKLKTINLEENLLGNDGVAILPLTEEGDNDILDNKIYKIRLLYKFIAENKSLIKMSVTKNDIFQSFQIFNLYKNNDNTFKVNRKGNIIINSLNSFLLKIKKEMLKKNNESDYNRNKFNLKFDCQSDYNLNSETFTNENAWI